MKWWILKGNQDKCCSFLARGKHSRLFASVDWQVVNPIDWYLRRTLTKDVKICVQTLRVIGQIPSQWELHTFCLFWSDFFGENQEKLGGGLFPPGKNQNRNQFVFLSFWGRPFKLAKFHWNWWDSMQYDCPGALVDTLLSSCSHHYSVVHWSRLSSLPLPSPHTQKILIIIANCGCPCGVFLYIASTKIISGSNFFKLVLFCFPLFWIVTIKTSKLEIFKP